MQTIIVDRVRVEDASLIGLLALHDADALSDLYDRYSRLVYSIAYHTVGEPEVAEEIVQEVFTRVWEKAYTYNASISNVSTWLINITRNRAIDEIRRSKARPEKNSIGWEEVSQFNIPHSQGPEEETELNWQQQLVREALDTLSPNEREVLALAYFKGYSQSKIAELLGIPLGTIKTRIRTAMHKLRRVLSPQLEDVY